MKLLEVSSRGRRIISFSQMQIEDRWIATDSSGPLQLLFPDGTSLTVGRTSELLISSFVFRPDENSASLSATLKRGAFRIMGGHTSKTAAGVMLTTPFGILALDRAGAEASLGVASEPPHFDMLFGKRMMLSRGPIVLAMVREAGSSIVPAHAGQPTRVTETPVEWRERMQERLSMMKRRPTESNATGPS